MGTIPRTHLYKERGGREQLLQRTYAACFLWESEPSGSGGARGQGSAVLALAYPDSLSALSGGLSWELAGRRITYSFFSRDLSFSSCL